MIELVLEAERAMDVGLIDKAERLYRQAIAADPRNSIAVVGLARVALERGDEAGALWQARRALAIDPDNPAARRLVDRMVEVITQRGDAAQRATSTTTPTSVPESRSVPPPALESAPEPPPPAPESPPEFPPAPDSAPELPPEPAAPGRPPEPAAPGRRGFLRRLIGRG